MSVYKLSFHVILSLHGDPSQAQGDTHKLFLLVILSEAKNLVLLTRNDSEAKAAIYGQTLIKNNRGGKNQNEK